MKTNQLSLFVLALFTCLFISCGPQESGNSTEEAEDTTAETMEEAEPEKVAPTATALIIEHEVADYDAWKVKFDEHASARQDAGMSDWALLTGRENPNMVTVIDRVDDMEAAKAFINSEDLKTAMAGAGVIGKPNMRFTKVEVLNQKAGESSTFRLYAEHDVEDYDVWRQVFDSKAEMHKKAGVSPVAIGRDMDNMNHVTVVLTAADFATLEAFMGNAELKAAMEEAGIVGEPEFNFMNIQSLEF